MRRFISKVLLYLGIFSLVLGAFGSFGANPGYAEDLELIGKEIGLEVTPSSTRLFDLTNLNPGDTKEATINIKNNYTSAFELFMRTERMSEAPGEEEPDMFKQLIITVYLGDEVIYTGSMMDFATSNISLGRFNPNTNKNLRAVIHLPGPETENEFQGESVEVKWIFIAQADKPEDPPYTPPYTPPTEPPVNPPEEEEIDEDIPEGPPEEPVEPPEEEEVEEDIPEGPTMPKTGDISSTVYYGLGTGLIGLGIGIGRKKKK